MKISVVIPTYDEADNLYELLAQLQALGIDDLDIVLIDDNSPDGTGQLAEDWARAHPGRLCVIHRERKLGLASAYTTGFRQALDMGAQLVIQMDADLSHDPQVIPRFLAEIDHADLVIGSRYIPGGETDEAWGVSRRLLSVCGNRYASLVAGVHARDATSGYRCFRASLLRRLLANSIRSNGYVFQVEMALASQNLGARLVEIPITFRERHLGRSKISLHVIMEAAIRVWQLRHVYRASGLAYPRAAAAGDGVRSGFDGPAEECRHDT